MFVCVSNGHNLHCCPKYCGRLSMDGWKSSAECHTADRPIRAVAGLLHFFCEFAFFPQFQAVCRHELGGVLGKCHPICVRNLGLLLSACSPSFLNPNYPAGFRLAGSLENCHQTCVGNLVLLSSSLPVPPKAFISEFPEKCEHRLSLSSRSWSYSFSSAGIVQ